MLATSVHSFLLSVELVAEKARDCHLETVGTLVKGSWSWTIAPESWGRGPCPISRAPGATADLVRERLELV